MKSAFAFSPVLLALLLAGCVAVPELQPTGPLPDAVDCGTDVDCFRQNVYAGQKAFVLVEEDGITFSHSAQECFDGICEVDIRVQKLPDDTPDVILAMLQGNEEMSCEVSQEELGLVPDNLAQCSGPLADLAMQFMEDAG